MLRFRVARGARGDEVTFLLEAEDGRPLLRSAPFADQESCMEAIQSALAQLLSPDRLPVVEEAARFFLALEDEEGEVLARSSPLATRAEATALRDELLPAAAAQRSYEVLFPETRVEASFALLPFRREAAADVALLYDFTFASRSGKQGFERFFREDRQLHYFHLNGADGGAILYSWGFDAAARRDKRLRAVVESAGLLQRFERREEGERFFFLLKARNGRELARSRSFASAEARESALSWVLSHSAELGAEILRSHGRRVAGKGQFVLLEGSFERGRAGFETFRRDEDGLHYFRFNDEDGWALFFSLGYRTKASCEAGIQTVIRAGAEADRFQLQEEGGRCFWVIRAANQKAIVRSRWFDGEAEARAAMLWVGGRLVELAPAFGVVIQRRAEVRVGSLVLERPDRPLSPDPVAVPAAPAAVPAAPAAVPAAPAAVPAAPAAVPAAPVAAPAAAGVPAAPLAAPSAPAPVKPPPALTPPAPSVKAEPAPSVKVEPRTSPSPAPEAPRTELQPAAARSVSRSWLWAVAALVVIAFVVIRCGMGPREDPPVTAGTATTSSSPVAAASTTGSSTTSDSVPVSPTTSGPAASSAVASVEPADAGTDPDPGHAAHVCAPGNSSCAPDPGPGDTSAGLEGLALPAGSMEAEIVAFLRTPGGQVPRVFTMDRLKYPPSSHEVDDVGHAQVVALARILRAFPAVTIEIRGHRDGTESELYTGPKPHDDFPLTKLRAHCIYQRLHYLKIPADRVRFVGEQTHSPITGDETAEGRQRNRRIEIVVVSR